jgi:hypothetical protein
MHRGLVAAWSGAALVASLTASPVCAAAVLLTFQGLVVGGSSGGAPPGCVSDPTPVSCAHDMPPNGVPLSIAMLLDTSLAPLDEGIPGGGTSSKYVMTGVSYIDFGYRPEFRLSDFYLRVVDNNIGFTEPDRLSVIHDEQAVYGGIPEVWFDLEFGSASTDFLSGPGLPPSLDLSLASSAGGNLYFSTNGVSSEYMQFAITSVTVSQPLPEPPTGALALMALFAAVGVSARSRLGTSFLRRHYLFQPARVR